MKLLEVVTTKMYNGDTIVVVNKSDTDKFKKLGFSLKPVKQGTKNPDKIPDKSPTPEPNPTDKNTTKQTGAV